MKRAFGHACLIGGCLFAVGETIHFGNNLFPGSPEELVCDVVALMLTWAGIVIIKSKP